MKLKIYYVKGVIRKIFRKVEFRDSSGQNENLKFFRFKEWNSEFFPVYETVTENFQDHFKSFQFWFFVFFPTELFFRYEMNSRLFFAEEQDLFSDLYSLHRNSTLRYFIIHLHQEGVSRGFNGSVNISENCDFRSQFNPFDIIL